MSLLSVPVCASPAPGLARCQRQAAARLRSRRQQLLQPLALERLERPASRRLVSVTCRAAAPAVAAAAADGSGSSGPLVAVGRFLEANYMPVGLLLAITIG